jgi:hypothetical protein
MKIVYGVFGAKHPTASLVAVTIIGALAAGAFWQVSASLYEHEKMAEHQLAPGSAQTTGDCSAAVTGSGNTVETSCDTTKTEPKKSDSK